jgi:hypothetical protein
MKRIRLNEVHTLTVDDKGYEQIEQLVYQHLVCGRCGRGYSAANPRVAANTCLQCFLSWHRYQNLTYLGVEQVNQSSTTYKFLGHGGFLHLSTDTRPIETLERSATATLRHWGFSVPEAVWVGGNERRLDPSYWHIYGNVQSNSVLVLKYEESYGERFTCLFLATSGQETVMVSKRSGPFRHMFLKARRVLQMTRDTRGAYHPKDGCVVYQLFDSHVYETVADLLSAEHDQQPPLNK